VLIQEIYWHFYKIVKGEVDTSSTDTILEFVKTMSFDILSILENFYGQMAYCETVYYQVPDRTVNYVDFVFLNPG